MFLFDIVLPMNVEEAKATSQRLDAKCWKGKHKEGTKVKGGVRVNNCVPNESVEEDSWHDGNNDWSSEQHEMVEAEVEEGYQDFNKVEPYEVCLAGKPIKQFDYYEDARRFHDNWKKKLYAQGEQAKADKITLNPIMKEAGNPAQQAAIAIAKKKEQDIEEMDKSQKGAAGWNIDDYPLGAKGTTVKPTTVKNVVKSATKDLDAAFNSPEQLKKDADYRAYRKGVKQSRKEQPKPLDEFAPGGGYQEPPPPVAKKKDPFEDDDRSIYPRKIQQLLTSGAKVDSRVPGAMGHIIAANGEMIRMKPLNKPYSQKKYAWYIGQDRDDKLLLKQVEPNHYVLYDRDWLPQGVAESTNYWTKLQNERNIKLNSLVNELKESIKK